jgi:hypothetical protein
MRHLAVALAAILLGACATEPTAPPEAPAATSAAVGIPSGYRLVERKGVRLLCSRATETGSRYSKETCMTEAEYVEMQARGQDVWQGIRNSVTTCGGTGTGACGSGSGSQ